MFKLSLRLQIKIKKMAKFDIIKFFKTNFKLDKIIKVDTIDSIIGLQEVRDGFGINKEGNVIAFLTLNGFDQELASEQEIDTVLRKFKDFLDTRISYPIALNISNSRNNLSEHNKTYNAMLSNSASITDKVKKTLSMFNEVNNYNYAVRFNIPEKKYVIALSFKVDLQLSSTVIPKSLNSFSFIPNNKWDRISKILIERVNQFAWFMNSGTTLEIRMMTSEEVYLYFKNIYWIGKAKSIKEEVRVML